VRTGARFGGAHLTQDEASALLHAMLTQAALRPDSLFALLTAANAMETDGISGTLVMKIPRKKDAPVDVNFTTGATHIGLDMP
jgi:hypothetical protein